MRVKYDPAYGFIVTKLDAARTQLETAIELWFRDGDPVSIHTLTAASRRITLDLAEHRKIPQGLGLFDPKLMPKGLEKDVKKLLRHPETFFKHAAEDPEATLKFNPQASEAYLFDAVNALHVLQKGATPLMAAFYYRFFLLGSIPSLDDPFPKLDENVRSSFREADKATFLRTFLEALPLLRVL